MQAAQLPVEEVEAEHARPRRAEEVLPLVRPPHARTGRPTVVARPDESGAPRPARGARARRWREPALAGAGGGAEREAARPEPSPTPPEAPAPGDGRNRGWGGNFIRESIAELKKVEWPTQNQLIQGTVVVIIACVIIGTYLYVGDQVFSKLVSKVLLGQ